MAPKYECRKCDRTFVHKETLDEHNFLHGRIIKQNCQYKCPICCKNVYCSSGIHSNVVPLPPDTARDTRKCKNSRVRVTKGTITDDSSPPQIKTRLAARTQAQTCTENVSENQQKKQKPRQSGILEREFRNGPANISTGFACELCDKSFAYKSGLTRHTSTAHGQADKNTSTSISTDGTTMTGESLTDAETDSSTELEDDAKPNDGSKNDGRFSHSDSVVKPTDLKPTPDDDGDPWDSTTHVPESAPVPDCAEYEAEAVSLPDGSLKLRLSKTTASGSAFTCKTCSKEFKYKTTLVRHWRVVHGGLKCDKCTCPICSHIFDNQLAFSKHFDTIHPKKATERLSELKSQDIGENGKLIVGDNPVVRCEPCSQWFTCKRSLLRHSGLKHRVLKGEAGQVRYRCVHCAESFETSKELVYHRHNVHYANKRKEDGQVRHPNESQTSNGSVHDDNCIVVPGISETLPSTGKVPVPAESDSDAEVPRDSDRYFCDECSKSFASLAFLLRHAKMKHRAKEPGSSGKSDKNKGRTFSCELCQDEFDREEALAEHIEFIHGNQRGNTGECSCPLCGSVFESQLQFSQHYEQGHKRELPGEIDAFDFFGRPLDFVDRPQAASNVQNCSKCLLWFTDRRAYLSHHCPKQADTAKRRPNRARYRCTDCGETFEILRKFLKHRQVKHSVQRPQTEAREQKLDIKPTDDVSAVATIDKSAIAVIVAESLGTESETHITGPVLRGRPPTYVEADGEVNGSKLAPSADLQLESDETHQTLADGAEAKCPECHRSFSTAALLRKHRKLEHRNRTCQICGETCKSADMVYYHNLKHHHEQKCDICGASCPGRLGLIEHYRAQHPKEPSPLINRKTLICEYCPRVFAGCASRLLRDHIESCHLGRVHLCDVCGKRLGSAQTLAVHRRMHDPVARFACHECNRRFPHNTNLINHIRKHHPERLPAKYVRDFRCEICLMQFGSSSGLTRHRSEKHGAQRFQCELCLRVFQSVAGLRVHKRREHGTKDPPPLVPVSDALHAHIPAVASSTLTVNSSSGLIVNAPMATQSTDFNAAVTSVSSLTTLQPGMIQFNPNDPVMMASLMSIMPLSSLSSAGFS